MPPRLTYEPKILEAIPNLLPVARPLFQKRRRGESPRRQIIDALVPGMPSGDITLPDIAALLEFANQNEFSRSYLRWSGQTPLQRDY